MFCRSLHASSTLKDAHQKVKWKPSSSPFFARDKCALNGSAPNKFELSQRMSRKFSTETLRAAATTGSHKSGAGTQTFRRRAQRL